MGDLSLGGVLRAHRSGAGLTIEELAGRAGVSARAVSDLERDRVRRPQRRTLIALLDALALRGADRDLVRRLADAGRTPPGPCPMPDPPAHFTGRRDTVAAIRALTGPSSGVPTGPVAVAVISGPPGVGKTAIALHVAHVLAADYPDGRFFADLRGTRRYPAAPAETLHRLLLALGVAETRIPADTAERARLFRRLLTHRRVLLVLDNAGTEEQIRPLLPGDGPGLVLITGRRSLSGLEAVRWLPQDPLPAGDAAALLHAVGSTPPGRDADQVAALAAHCGHLPLALRIVGRRLRDEPGLTVPVLSERLARAQDRIAVLDGGTAGLATALTVSYRALPPSGRRTLRRLALVPGPDFTADLAAVLCGTGPVQAEEHLDALVECGLLTPRPPDRYGLHDLIRAFAATRLRRDEPDGGRALGDRLTRWLLTTTVRAGRWFEPGGPPLEHGTAFPVHGDAARARAWLDAELDNWVPALRAGAETGLDALVMATADALHWFSDQRLQLGIWPEVFRLGAEAALRADDAAAQAVHLNYLSWAQALCDADYPASLGTATEAMRRAETAGDLAQQGWALVYAASAHTGLGEHRPAARLRQRAWVLFRRAGDHEGLPQAMRGLGASLHALGRTTEALRVHRATLRLLRDPATPIAGLARAYSDAMTCRSIGITLAAAARWAESVAAYREALAGVRACGLRSQEPSVRIGLATALRHTGGAAEAAEHLMAAAVVARELGDPQTAARAETALAPDSDGRG
ncbi:ATP-binding protein [Catenuloplanes indicus]|uniref:Tetratricopeptide (TPR) repeat protein n=1 Tax=Catenuloplanes indicus TaxID=137267 RepID=A0AAE3VVD2_9ACTN|nr:helix-turn-helix domain-containing protein [Catenuloplanes indicus]MDQ0364436.1 tetratricopeptide (TPR) repeat protein [Catenuloplanes indicus]